MPSTDSRRAAPAWAVRLSTDSKVPSPQPQGTTPRVGRRSEIRLLFVFDPWRSAILLVGGDKSGNWSDWYRQAIPRAEELYVEYVKERETEEGQR